SAGLPVEELKFAFGAITEAVGVNSDSASWSQTTESDGSPDIPGLPATLALRRLPDVPPPDAALRLAGRNPRPPTPDLDAFRFGFYNSATIAAGGGATAGKVSFDPLDVTTALSAASPGLFHALASGAHYDTATLAETNPAGQSVAVWVLGDVFI